MEAHKRKRLSRVRDPTLLHMLNFFFFFFFSATTAAGATSAAAAEATGAADVVGGGGGCSAKGGAEVEAMGKGSFLGEGKQLMRWQDWIGWVLLPGRLDKFTFAVFWLIERRAMLTLLLTIFWRRDFSIPIWSRPTELTNNAAQPPAASLFRLHRDSPASLRSSHHPYDHHQIIHLSPSWRLASRRSTKSMTMMMTCPDLTYLDLT